ncbi:MAG TPA: response regulator [Candidatus Saccharimonadales bacterium]|nr:response regulator [Candidatus Saccharimonadales bacterium]
MKVLVIDDSKTARAVVVHSLAPLGCTVLQAGDGAEGLEIMRGAKPDLVISDAHMPNVDGMTMLTLKARDPQVAGIPVIMLTAVADQDFVLQCLKRGAKAYVVKPFEKKTLVMKVCKVLRIEPPAPAEAQVRAHGPLVLAVDRDEKQLSALMEFLLNGCELLTALDLRPALRIARERRPDAVWLDVSEPAEQVRGFVETLRGEGLQHWAALVNRGAPVPPVALELHLGAVLPKPFIRVEVREFAARHLGVFQRFLSREGNAVVMSVPGDPQVRRKEWQPALEGQIRSGLQRAASDGAGRLVVDLTSVAAPADLHLVAGLVDVLEMAHQTNLDLILAVGDPDLVLSFSAYQDLKGTRCVRGLREALAISAPPAEARPAA